MENSFVYDVDIIDVEIYWDVMKYFGGDDFNFYVVYLVGVCDCWFDG